MSAFYTSLTFFKGKLERENSILGIVSILRSHRK